MDCWGGGEAAAAMALRVASAAVALPLLVAVVWLGEPWYTLLVALAALLGSWEFHRMAGQGVGLSALGVLGAFLFVANARLGGGFTAPLLTAAVVFSLVGSFLFQSRPGLQEEVGNRAFLGALWALGGMLYVGWLLGHFIWLRQLEGGRGWVLLALFSTFATDTGAFLVGRAWGKRPLAPLISPGKTWEGAIGGLLASTVAAPLLAYVFGLLGDLPLAIFLGFLIGIVAQLGDLSESLLKRGSGVKDAGFLIPGHGGILDRMDSLVFTGALVYYYATFVLGAR